MLVLLIFAICVSISHSAAELGIGDVLQYNPNCKLSRFIRSFRTHQKCEAQYFLSILIFFNIFSASFIPTSTDNSTESVFYDQPISNKNCIGRIKMLTHEDNKNRGHRTFIILDSTPKLYFSKVLINREPLSRAYVEKSKIQIAAARCDKGSGEFNDFFVLEKHSQQ